MLLNSLFSDGMVLQQKENVAFWGTSKPNQKVEVIGSWGTKSETTSDNDGEWILYLNTPAAGGPFNIIKFSFVWHERAKIVRRINFFIIHSA